MKNKNFKRGYLFGIAMLVAVFAFSSYAVFATNITSGTSYSDHSGNYSGFYKVDGYSSKTVYFKSDLSVSSSPTSRFIVFTTTGHKYVAFSATNISVSGVY